MTRHDRHPLRVLATALATSSLVASACAAQRPTLRVPAPTAPAAERLAAFQELRPANIVTGVYRERITDEGNARFGTALPSGRSTDRTETFTVLRLKNGLIINDPGVLVTAVEESSDTAAAIKAFDAARSREADLTWVSLGVLGASVIAGVIALESDEADLGGVILTVGSLGAIGVFIASLGASSDASDARAAAFETYEEDLRARLGVVEQINVAESGAGAPAVVYVSANGTFWLLESESKLAGRSAGDELTFDGLEAAINAATLGTSVIVVTEGRLSSDVVTPLMRALYEAKVSQIRFRTETVER